MSKPETKDKRSRLIAAIHAAAKTKGLDEETRRALMMDEVGKRSAADCADAELSRVLSRINGGSAFRPSRRPEIRKIFALWTDLKRRGALDNPTRAGLRVFCGRMSGAGDAATDPEFLTAHQANLVIEALKSWVARTKKGSAS